MSRRLGTYSPVKIDYRPDDTLEETLTKTIEAFDAAIAEVEENKRLEEERRKKGFLGRLFR